MPVFLTPGGLTALPPAAPTTAPDLVAAVVTALRADTPLSLAFTAPGGTAPKFHSDVAVGVADLPHLVVTEGAISYAPESPAADGSVSYTGPGEITVDVYAATKTDAKAYRAMVIAALSDADLTNADTHVHYFRQARPVSPPEPGVQVGLPQAYKAGVTFQVIAESIL